MTCEIIFSIQFDGFPGNMFDTIQHGGLITNGKSSIDDTID